MYERNQRLTLLKSPASSNPVDLGWIAVRTHLFFEVGNSGVGSKSSILEAMVNVCGVAVAMPQGYSWAPHPTIGS